MIKKRMIKENWQSDHRRCFQIAGMTIMVESDLPFEEATFSSTVQKFGVSQPGNDLIHLRHHFFIPKLKGKDYEPIESGEEMFQIYQKHDVWIYISSDPPHNPLENPDCIRVEAVFKKKHTQAYIYHQDDTYFREGNSNSLFFVAPDQLFISLLLADRQGCYLHSSGINLNNNGFLFLGHSGAGKSTVAKLLKRETELLCDDRVIIRRWPEGFKIHGTWSHGELSDVSPASAPLRALLFIEKDKDNFLIPLKKKKDIVLKLMECLVIPVATSGWWGKMFDLFDKIATEIPCYVLHFDTSGKMKKLIQTLCK